MGSSVFTPPVSPPPGCLSTCPPSFLSTWPLVTWHANAAVYFLWDTFSGDRCQRQYYAGNIQVLTVKTSDGQINRSGRALARPNREEIVCERPTANETHEGEAAQSLIITPPSIRPSVPPSFYPPFSLCLAPGPGDFQPPLSFIFPAFDFNVTFISRSFPAAPAQGRPFIRGSEPLNSLLCSDLWRSGRCRDKRRSAGRK